MTSKDLAGLGWSDAFAQQLDGADANLAPARISAVHRTQLKAQTADGQISLVPDRSTAEIAVGDWVLYEGAQMVRLLDRTSVIQRRAAGEVARAQLVAANVDTLGIVTSCNADFNTARLQRYLIMASAADITPLIILTKADLAEDPDDYVKQAESLSPLITAITLNAKDHDDVARLAPWCGPGKTLALVGSSGVGKTTLQNALTGGQDATQAIRQDDAKGRHTTTARFLSRAHAGGCLIDTPGMRELGMSEADAGIEAVFDDITDLIPGCRFNDCAHESEPGCAVQAAVAQGTLPAERLAEWRKLQRENQINSESVAQSRSRLKSRERVYNSGKKRGRHKRQGK